MGLGVVGLLGGCWVVAGSSLSIIFYLANCLVLL